MFTGVCSRRSINSVAPHSAAAGSTAVATEPDWQELQAAKLAAVEHIPDTETCNEVLVAAQPELAGSPPQHNNRYTEQHEPEAVQATASVQSDNRNESAAAMGDRQQFWEQDEEQHEQEELAPAADTEGSYLLLQQQQQYEELQELQASYKAAEQQRQQQKAKASGTQHTAQHRVPQLQQQQQHSVEQQQLQYSAAASSTVAQLQQELMQQAKLREVKLLQDRCRCILLQCIGAICSHASTAAHRPLGGGALLHPCQQTCATARLRIVLMPLSDLACLLPALICTKASAAYSYATQPFCCVGPVPCRS
jgi:hypothetical protein